MIDDRTLNEIYLPAFKEAVDNGVLTIMTAANGLNYNYVSDDRKLLTDILKNKWGFQGFVMTDWLGTRSTEKAAFAGLDVSMPGGDNCGFGKPLLEAVKQGRVSEAEIDDKVRRVLHGTNGDPIYDITEILKQNPVNPQFGPEGKPHWWGKPQLGYYVNTDDFVYDKHLQMLTDAGVDFLFMDVTNAFTYDDAVKRLMAAIDRRTNFGLPSPKLVYTINANASGVVKHLWDVFYSNPDYDKYWFYYRGKPLLLVNIDDIASLSDEIKTHFTTRHCWAWRCEIQEPFWTGKASTIEVEAFPVQNGS